MPMLHRSMLLDRQATATRFDPERMFRPRSVVVLGADGRVADQVLGNLQQGGFANIQVVPAGMDPAPADLAVFTSQGEALRPWIPGLQRAGIFAGVSLGLAPDVAECQNETGIYILGPGSFGVAAPALNLNATLSHLAPQPGRVALISQSAALCRAVLDWAGPNGVGFSQIVGIGGNAGTGFNNVLDFLSHDSATGPILMDIRRLRNPRRFLSAARAAARLRPIVALRAGSRLLDPTGRAEAVFDAALNRAGVLTVTRLDDLLAALETLTRAPALRGEGLAIVTNAIGPGRMAADAALGSGIALATLAPETSEVLRLRVPGSDARDIIYVGMEEPGRLGEAVALLAGAREVGGILAVMAPTGPGDALTAESLAAFKPAQARVPLLVCAMGETTGAIHRRRLAEAGLPVFATPEQAVQGFRHLLQQRRARAAAQELPPGEVLELLPDRAAVRAMLDGARADGRLALTKAELQTLLAAYGVVGRPPLPVMLDDDPLFGPFIGIGGQRVSDSIFDLPPLNLPLATSLIAHAPSARALLPAPERALADILVRISQMAVDVPELAALSIGPSADPAATLRPPGQLGRLSIAPYPAHLAEAWDAKGIPVTIRPIRPEDAAAHAAFFTRLTPDDIRYRFFSALRQLSPERIGRMTQVDYDREMAFVAVRGEDTVGVARLICDGDAGEFAVVVQPDMKGHGLAKRLMQRLIDWATSQGMTAVVGQVLADNQPMLAFMRRLGFTLHRMADEPDVVEARFEMGSGPGV